MMVNKQQIQKEHLVKERYRKIVDVVIPTLSGLYGAPDWLIKPKKDQKPELIIQQWAEKLGDYSKEQLETACLEVFKWNKSRSFPTMVTIQAQLVGEVKEDVPVNKGGGSSSDLITILMERDYNKLHKQRPHAYWRIHYQEAVKCIINEILPQVLSVEELNAIECKKRERRNADYDQEAVGYRCRMAMEKGLFDNFDEVLERTYQKIEGQRTTGEQW